MALARVFGISQLGLSGVCPRGTGVGMAGGVKS